jgi:uncharacterized iron-regulated protein
LGIAVPVCGLGCAGTTAEKAGPAAPAAAPAAAPPDSADSVAALLPTTWISPLQREHALVGRIWDTRAGRYVTADELARRAAKARFVLLGETHDNADHHELQAAVIAMLARAERRPAVVFEMIEGSRQARIDAQLAAAPKDVDALGAALEWDGSGWPPWAIYRPVFAAALDAGAPLVGAALPRAEAMELARGERRLPAELVARYRLDSPLPSDLQTHLVAELKASHCGHMPDAMIAPMAGIQRARDAIMADRLASGATTGATTDATTDGAVLIAGGGHVRGDRGVPWYLRQAGVPEGDILTVGFVQVAADAPAPGDYKPRYDGALPFDYLWFTPQANDIDRCAELEQRMKQMKAGKHGADQ